MEIWNFLKSNYQAIVALCALAVSISESVLARQHNKLSVMPRIEIVHDANYIDDPATNNQIRHVFLLKNVGLGPALIKDFQFSFTDASGRRRTSVRDIEQAIEQINRLNNRELIVDFHVRVLGPGVSVLPNTQTAFLEATCLQHSENTRNLLRQIFEEAQVSVLYESLYKQSFFERRG